jgi:RNA polymerase sigma-70 factor (ECF subfamily)
MSDSNLKPEFDIPALRAGDKTEFARLVEAYSPQVFRLALKMLQNQQDAEDILQETFIKAYKALPRFEGRSSLSTWLYRIATNEALMFLRRKRPDQISVEQPTNDDTAEIAPLEIIDWCCLPEGELMSAEARANLESSVSRLPQSLRVVFLLRDIEGLSTRETAEVLDISESAVKTRLSRARLHLRELLTSYYAGRVTLARERGEV